MAGSIRSLLYPRSRDTKSARVSGWMRPMVELTRSPSRPGMAAICAVRPLTKCSHSVGRRRQERSLSVTSTSGAKPCFLSSLRISFTAAALSRHRCTSTSRTSPSLSTASQPKPPARSHHGHLIEMLLRRRPMRGRCNSGRIEARTSSPTPAPFRRRHPGHAQRAICNVAIAERETHIKPDGVPDRRGRQLVAGKRDHRPPSYLANRDALLLLVTNRLRRIASGPLSLAQYR